MKGVDGMIRLQKWQLDEKRRELSDMEVMRHDLLGRAAALEDEMRTEQHHAATSESGYAYGAYASGVIERRRVLQTSIREVERSIDAKKREISEAFQDLKKYEILAERQVIREKEAEAKKAQANIDEISLNMFRRAKVG